MDEPTIPTFDEPRHSREDLLTIRTADSFGVSYETLYAAFHHVGIQTGQLLSRCDVEAALKAHAERIIP